VESRKSARFSVQIPLSIIGTGHESNGIILNISREGCLVTVEPTVPLQDYVQLDMRLREGEEAVHIELAAVRWSSGSKVGLEYIRLKEEQQNRLLKFMAMLERNTTGEIADNRRDKRFT